VLCLYVDLMTVLLSSGIVGLILDHGLKLYGPGLGLEMLVLFT